MRGHTSHAIICLTAAALIGFCATTVQAQPFGGYMVLDGDPTDYIEIPHHAALNPTGAITLEGWVRFDEIACVSLIGKNYLQAFWVGPCDGSFRSYTRGIGTSTDAGTFTTGVWTHFAVTDDGATRKHYLNGVEVGTFPVSGALTSSTAPVRIGSDVPWPYTPKASLDEFRLWNVARSQAEIQSTMNTSISTPEPGLVAVWPLDGSGADALGVHDGAVVGSPAFVSRPLVGTPDSLEAVSIIGNTVTLGWRPGAGQSAATNHLLEGGINPGDVAASIPTGSANPFFTIVAPSGAFYVRVKTVSGTNVGANSNEIRIFVNTPAVPSAPVGLLGLANGSNLALSWKNTWAGGAPSAINLTVTGAVSATLTLPGSAESFTYAGVPPGSYTFTVSAANAAGTSAASNALTLAFPGTCAGPPQTPPLFRAFKSGSVITVRWNAPLAGPALSGYTLNVGGSFVGSIPTTGRSLSGTVAAGNYALSLVATNPCGTSVATAPWIVAIP